MVAGEMQVSICAVSVLCGALCAFGQDVAEPFSWEQRLARRASPRWETIQAELGRIDGELESLPKIPIEDSGGSGGLATFVQTPVATADLPELRIDVLWTEPKEVDLVALVPARNYDVDGVTLDYGLPDSFSVELIGADGSALPLAVENDVRSSAVRAGYPFVYPLETPVMAKGLRIRALRLFRKESEAEGTYLFALSEVLCFSNGRNVARGARVETPHQPQQRNHWHWQNAFVVDGQTTLGLPEMPAVESEEIGWLSKDRASADNPAWITVDLGKSRRFDGLRIHPIRRPSKGHLPGFGIPRRFRIAVSDSGVPASYSTVLDHTNSDMENQGHNPVEFTFPVTGARYVKFEATRLWKPFELYPAFLALSEIEVLDGNENIALGAGVVSSDQTGRVRAHANLFWSEASLTDGRGPQGVLVSPSEWLLALNRRLQLETKRQALLAEADSIVASIRRWVSGLLVAAGGVGLFFSVILPVRYRWLRKRDFNRVRERISGDLHDEVGSNLGCIQVLSDLIREQMPGSRELMTIRRIAAETVTAVRDIVWLLRARMDERVCIVDHLRESGGILLESMDWTFDADESLASYDVSDEKARDLMLFYREALHNVIRHANARRVEIRMKREGNEVVLSIADDGCGIPPERLEQPGVLLALKQRARLLNGKLKVSSEPGEGTLIVLVFPA